MEAQRRRLERRLERLREVYLDGDLGRTAYQEQRAALNTELASLPVSLGADDRMGRRLASLLADVAGAWKAATPEEQNKLARQLFTEVIIDNSTVVAVKPRPELLPFFRGVTFACVGGSDGLWSRAYVIFPTMPSSLASYPRFLAWGGRAGPPIKRHVAGSSLRSRRRLSRRRLNIDPCVSSPPHTIYRLNSCA